jgi:hypothetical protein
LETSFAGLVRPPSSPTEPQVSGPTKNRPFLWGFLPVSFRSARSLARLAVSKADFGLPVSASQNSVPRSGVRQGHLGATLGDAVSEEADTERAAKAALQRLASQRATWLLVYDNVASPSEIADLLPSGGARVLITSRFLDWTGLADEVPLSHSVTRGSNRLPSEPLRTPGRGGRADACSSFGLPATRP